MWYQDPITKIIDNNCPNTIETHLKSGRINTTSLYGAFEIPLLAHFLLYRNADVDVLKQLIQLCLNHGADVNQWTMDTDDEWVSPLNIAVGYYLGLCIEKGAASRKIDILGVISLLIKSGADPRSEHGTDNGTVIDVINVFRPPVSPDPDAVNLISADDMNILCIIVGC